MLLAGMLSVGMLSIGMAHAAPGARPAAFDHRVSRLDDVEMRLMPAVDVARLRSEDVQREARDLAPRFAQSLAVNLTRRIRAQWEDSTPTTSSGACACSRAARCRSISVSASTRCRPAGACWSIRRHYAATDDQSLVRSFTAADNEAHGQLWTPIVPGEEAVIEVVVPRAHRGAAEAAPGEGRP